MKINKRKPFTADKILHKVFLEPATLTQGQLAELMGVPHRRARNKRTVTPDTAIRLGRIFDVSPEYELNLQMRSDLWKRMHDPKARKSMGKWER